VAVGRRSYGLYLYHWPIFVLGRELPLPLWKINLLGLLVTVAVAEASYRWIETVVDLGANGTVQAADIDAVIAAAGDRRVVLVGVHVPRRWQDGNNDVLRAAAAAHPTVEFVDWDALVAAHPGALGPDGVHPGLTGRTLLASAVADAARRP